jgi:hypothetical protein
MVVDVRYADHELDAWKDKLVEERISRRGSRRMPSTSRSAALRDASPIAVPGHRGDRFSGASVTPSRS